MRPRGGLHQEDWAARPDRLSQDLRSGQFDPMRQDERLGQFDRTSRARRLSQRCRQRQLGLSGEPD